MGPCVADTGALLCRACTAHVMELPASASRCAADETDHNRICEYHWLGVQRHSALVEVCLSQTSAPRLVQSYSIMVCCSAILIDGWTVTFGQWWANPKSNLTCQIPNLQTLNLKSLVANSNPNPKSPKISESRIFSTQISDLDQIASFIDHCLTSSNKDHHHHCHIIISHHHMTMLSCMPSLLCTQAIITLSIL